MKKLSLILAFLFAMSGVSHASIAIVQEAECPTKSGNTETCTFTAPYTAGDFLIAAVSSNTGYLNSSTFSVSDNINGAWTQAGSLCGSPGGYSGLFYLPSSAAGTLTVTFTTSFATPTTMYIDIAEYSGLASTASLDVAPVCGTASGANPTITPSISTTNANDLIVASAGALGNPGTLTIASPYTLRTTGSRTSPGLADQLVSSASTYSGASFTAQYSGQAVPWIAAFKAAGSSPPPSSATQIGIFCVGP